MPSRVKLLPENLINQIAAGEVVERPASILKELLDNSLDAGANRIEVDILDGGKKLIRVTDNGGGLNKEELFLCVERHATSKLGPQSDLLNIATLGFRGEALPSIGSVCRLSILSSPSPEGPGHKLRLEGGKLLGLDPAPANQGTSVEARDLFYNVPARKKFLKSEATERAHLIDVATRYALARPDLSLVFKDAGKTLLAVERREEPLSRIAKVLGRDLAAALRPLAFSLDDLEINGWLASPEMAQRTSSYLFLYVLGRPVKDRLLTKAIVNGYGRTLPPGRYPAGVVNVNLDPRRVDVNVHPAKTEVRFREPGQIFTALSDLTAQTVTAPPTSSLAAGEARPEPGFAESPSQANSQPGPDQFSPNLVGGSAPRGTLERDYARPFSDNPSSPYPAYPSPPRPYPNRPFRANATASYPSYSSHPSRPGAWPSPDPLSDPRDLTPRTPPWLVDEPPLTASDQPGAKDSPSSDLLGEEPPVNRILGQLGQSYILAQGADGLIVIDQHAAHERVLFNELKRALAEKGLPSQRSLFPETVELSAHQILAVNSLQKGLALLGFELEPFGGATYVIKGFPAVLDPTEAKEALLETLAKAQSRLKELDGSDLKDLLDKMSDSWLDTLACRAAVKAGDKLTLAEMETLTKDIEAAIAGGFCPHGRPAITVITYKELESKFNRR